jgi:hypothetical protein
VNRAARGVPRALVVDFHPHVVQAGKRAQCVRRAAGQRDVRRRIARAADQSRDVPHRPADRLRLVERGVLEAGEARERMDPARRQTGLVHVQLLRERDLERGRRRARNAAARGRSAPRRLDLLLDGQDRVDLRSRGAQREQALPDLER